MMDKSNQQIGARKDLKPGLRSPGKWEAIALGVLLVALLAAALMAPAHRWGDASTYYLQAQSILVDHDIQYTPQDIDRILQHPFDDTPSGLFLVKTADGRYFYGKDFSYALFASPFFLLLGSNGFAVFNALMFFGMILMGYLYLRKDNGPYAVIYSAIFFLLSIYFVYIFWIHADIYNVFLIMLGLFLWTVYNRNASRTYLVLASMALGLAVVAKAPNAIVFLPLALFELYKKRYSNLLLACAGFAVPVLLFVGFFYLQTGSLSYYGGDRYYYGHQFPFMDGYDATHEAGVHDFSVNSGATAGNILNFDDPGIVPYNLFYYFFGRFTGMLWYFPFAAFALAAFLWDLRKPASVDRLPEKLCLLAVIALYILLFVTVIGNNYAGNQIGNRYFHILPAFVLLLGKVDVKKAAVFLLIALFTVLPLVTDPMDSPTPEVRLNGFPYSSFPLEYTQVQGLPILGTSYPYQGHTITVYGDRLGYSDDTLIVEKPMKMTILSPVPLDRLKLAFMPNDDRMAHTVTIDLDGLRKETIVDITKGNVVILDDIAPAYRNDRYSIYELSVGIKPA